MALDRRLNVYRPDKAEAALEGQVSAAEFVTGVPARIAVSTAEVRPKPKITSGIDTQFLFGEPVTVFDRADGWAWVKSGVDSYVGYLPDRFLTQADPEPTHWVIAPRTFLYSEAELKTPVAGALSMGARIHVVGDAEKRGTRYLELEDGRFIVADHCGPVGVAVDNDYVSIAARFLETPYLWGGRSAFGLDCSALVQLSMMMAGTPALRDSDMQAERLGVPVEETDLQRGDLVFWKGHVGILEDAETLLHANGNTMSVAREGLKSAIKRIAPLYGEPTGFRRP